MRLSIQVFTREKELYKSMRQSFSMYQLSEDYSLQKTYYCNDRQEKTS